MNGAGAAYNSSVMVLAEINANIACDHFSRDCKRCCLTCTATIGTCICSVRRLAQRTRLYSQAVAIRDELRARQSLDATRGQFIRAEAAVANRRGGLDPLPRGRFAMPRPASAPSSTTRLWPLAAAPR